MHRTLMKTFFLLFRDSGSWFWFKNPLSFRWTEIFYESLSKLRPASKCSAINYGKLEVIRDKYWLTANGNCFSEECLVHGWQNFAKCIRLPESSFLLARKVIQFTRELLIMSFVLWTYVLKKMA
uniref:(northern house mosquito) hypothetical protein n=1 Tax=Culex pipiens TaxID=7175 RepID=A0A8D8NUI8_CULPI